MFDRLIGLFKKPSRWIIKVYKDRAGKRKKKKILRDANQSRKTLLQKNHFGNFSPIKRF